MQFNPNVRNVIAASSVDHTIKTYDVETGELLYNIGLDDDNTSALEWHNNGNLIGTIFKTQK